MAIAMPLVRHAVTHGVSTASRRQEARRALLRVLTGRETRGMTKIYRLQFAKRKPLKTLIWPFRFLPEAHFAWRCGHPLALGV